MIAGVCKANHLMFVSTLLTIDSDLQRADHQRRDVSINTSASPSLPTTNMAPQVGSDYPYFSMGQSPYTSRWLLWYVLLPTALGILTESE